MKIRFLQGIFVGILIFALIASSGCDLFDTDLSARAPSVEITSPRENDLIAGIVPVFIQTEAFLNSPDNRIEKVNVAIDGDPVGEAQRATFGSKPVFFYMWNTLGTGDGAHRIQAEAVDTDGARGLSSIETLTVENGLNNGPLVSIVQPLSGQEVHGKTSIKVSTIPNEPVIAAIDLLIDGVTAARLQGPDYTFEWDTLLESPGTHTLQAKALGTNGMIRLSMVVPVSVTGG